MLIFPAALQNLSDQFARLPGVGSKTAQRLAFHVLSLLDVVAVKCVRDLFREVFVDRRVLFLGRSIGCYGYCQSGGQCQCHMLHRDVMLSVVVRKKVAFERVCRGLMTGSYPQRMSSSLCVCNDSPQCGCRMT